MAFQELMIAPTGAESLEQAVRMGSEIYHALKGIIVARFGAPGELSNYFHVVRPNGVITENLGLWDS